ncbi:MAG: TIGR04255 family protein [Desulfomonile sp.]
MTQEEIFTNPTVKQVIFQIRFPSLFAIENRIDSFQEKIVDELPESALIQKQSFVWTDVVQPSERQTDPVPGVPIQKIWRFRSPKGYTVNVSLDSVDISSELHKTYKNIQSENRFRDIIQKVLESFGEVYKLRSVNRVGLRYIDECPVTKATNGSFKRYYNSVFPLDRFSLNDAEEMLFRTVNHRNGFFLTYMEFFKINNGKPTYTLDFDGFAKDVAFTECLSVTDSLHEIISNEYFATIRKPVKNFMRKDKAKK